MNRIVVLGSSSGMPDPERACSSILIEAGDKSYLIDAGEGCASSILRHKIDPFKIKQVFITHTHADHCIGIFMLVQMMHLLANKEFISEENLPNKMESYSFGLDLGGERIFYSSDIADLQDIENLIEEADLLFCESTHINVEELLELVKRKKVKKTILTHIPEELEVREDELIKTAKEMEYENLKFAFDGLRINLS